MRHASERRTITVVSGMETREVIYRHSGTVRITHWINALVLLVLLMSGLQIFNAHPALYLGAKSNFDDPILAMQPMMHDDKVYGVTTLFGWQFDTTGVFGLAGDAASGYDDARLPVVGDAARPSRPVHGAALALLLRLAVSLQRAAYLLWSLGSGHLRRDLAPTAKEPQAYRRLDLPSMPGSNFPKATRPSATTFCRSSATSSSRWCCCR